MFLSDQYQLIDFGQSRKLERFGEYLVDRPCPVAERQRRAAAPLWTAVAGRYEAQSDGSDGWTAPLQLPPTWTIRYGTLAFELRPTPFGHLGVFPEQAENWDWIAERLRSQPADWKVLNLFAYTGGATLAAAAAGAQVVHVDAARNVVAWARRNAALSGLGDAPIRWISEDARVFVQRELRRGARYDAVILDPPSYGHGPKGQAWKIEQHLESLLAACGELLRGGPGLVLLTCHTPIFALDDLRQLLARTCAPERPRRIEAKSLTIRSSAGRSLPSGLVVRTGG